MFAGHAGRFLATIAAGSALHVAKKLGSLGLPWQPRAQDDSVGMTCHCEIVFPLSHGWVISASALSAVLGKGRWVG